MMIHELLFSTVHEQPTSVITPTLFVAAPAVCVATLVVRVNPQPAPSCSTAKSCPAILMMAERAMAVGFASTL
jgi:hypothetical protein